MFQELFRVVSRLLPRPSEDETVCSKFVGSMGSDRFFVVSATKEEVWVKTTIRAMEVVVAKVGDPQVAFVKGREGKKRLAAWLDSEVQEIKGAWQSRALTQAPSTTTHTFLNDPSCTFSVKGRVFSILSITWKTKVVKRDVDPSFSKENDNRHKKPRL